MQFSFRLSKQPGKVCQTDFSPTQLNSSWVLPFSNKRIEHLQPQTENEGGILTQLHSTWNTVFNQNRQSAMRSNKHPLFQHSNCWASYKWRTYTESLQITLSPNNVLFHHPQISQWDEVWARQTWRWLQPFTPKSYWLK